MHLLVSKFHRSLFIFVAGVLFINLNVESQVAPPTTPEALIHLEAYMLGSGTWTHFDSARNLSLTPGVALRFRTFLHIQPSLEARATFPVAQGSVAGLSSRLVGPGLSVSFNRFHPYARFLFGTGTINFVHPAGSYKSDDSTVYDYGGGVDFVLPGNPHWAICAELSEQQWKLGRLKQSAFTPITVSMGLRYRLFRHPRY